MCTYEHQGLELYRSLSYQECRELLEISAANRVDPEIKLQQKTNAEFNRFLDGIAYNKYRWQYLPKPLNLWQIHKESKKLLQ